MQTFLGGDENRFSYPNFVCDFIMRIPVDSTFVEHHFHTRETSSLKKFLCVIKSEARREINILKPPKMTKLFDFP
jgi:hypothetical protein